MPVSTPPIPPAPPSAARLLIVDDEARNVTALMQTLGRQGYATSGAHSAAEALALLRAQPFDLLLTDLMMPQTNGIELLRQALAIDPHIVGILMTGQGTIDTAVEAMKSGAHDYILKPFNLTVILPVLERTLMTRRLRIENATLVDRLTRRTAELEAANQALQSANKELDSFAQSISHDLRTPLNAVIGFADLIRDPVTGPLNETQQQYLTHILEGGTRLRDLTEALLRFARLGQQPLSKASVEMQPMIEGIVAELRAHESGRRIEVRIPVCPRSLADADLMRQVFYNLLSNAFKYTRQVEQPLVEITVRDEGDAQVYRIRDNGAGFDMKDATRLFSPFQRLHRQDQFEGTGVGLSLVKRIIERHGGHIAGVGEPGKGAEFTISLPKAGSVQPA
jgi:two-component system, sensor histidine kinase and response regulator